MPKIKKKIIRRTTKKLIAWGTILTVLLQQFGFLTLVKSPLSPKLIEAASSTITSRVDFDTGFHSNTESKSSAGNLKLNADGTWNARVWRTPNLTLTDGTTFTTDGTYTYMLVGRDNRLSRYRPEEDRWETLARSPHTGYSGADMVYLNNYIYVLFGGYQKEFSRYSIATNSWSELADAPELTYSGSSLATDGTYLYALRGSSTTDFWRYNPSTNNWSILTGPSATISTGADLIYDNSLGTSYLYTPRGANTTTFYQYDISAGSWTTKATVPASLNDNGNMTKRGDYIYVLRGSNTQTFYRYQISANTWSTLTNTPTAARYVGLTYNTLQDLIYVFRGNSTYDWWKYNADTDSYLGSADLPATPGTGADLVYLNSKVYYRRGNNQTAFYEFDPSGNSWTTKTAAPTTFNDDNKGIAASGNLYYFGGSNTTVFYRYNVLGDSWDTLGVTPGNVSYGASLAYPGSGDYIYGTRGALTTAFWRYSIAGDSWDDGAVTDMPTDSENGYGARLVSDGTDIYAITGSGIARILKYSISGNNWTVLGNLPFSPYYGTDTVYYNGKIYAISGYYKTGFWEYTISTNTWHRLSDYSGYYAYDVGSYNGGSIASDGSGTFYQINGAGLSRILSYTESSYNYPVSGTWTSSTIDLDYVSSWTSLTASTTISGDSSISYQTRSSSDQITWSDWQAVSDGTISSPTARYIQARATLTATTDRTQTPTLSDMTITYSGDTNSPSNPTSYTAKSQAVAGITLTDNYANGYNYANPYFVWEGATDSETSIAGYYVYFGSNASADPETAGNYQTTANYTATTSLSTGTYYLRIKTEDALSNISDAETVFTYKYVGVSPPVSLTKTTTADFDEGTLTNVSSTNDQIKLSSKVGFWQQERMSLAPAGFGYGSGFAYVSSSNKLYSFRGQNTTSFYEYDIATDTWSSLANAPATVYYGGEVVEGPAGYLYGLRGYNTNTFWVYDIAENAWSDANAADVLVSVSYGSSLMYDGSQYIYLLRGNSDDGFYRYDTQTDYWEALTNVDFGAPSSQVNNFVYIGGDLAYDGDSTLYALQGNTRSGLAAYDIQSDAWSQLTNVPALPYDGAQIAYDSTSNAIYYTKGWGDPNFYKYDLTSQTWLALTDAPATLAYGSAMRNINGILYITRGSNTNTVYRYNIAKASWLVPTVGLFGGEYRGGDYRTYGYGAQIVKGDGNYYYLTRGNYDDLFVRYDSTTGESVLLADAPTGFYRGSATTFNEDENKIYIIGSQYDPFLYTYDIATDSWSQISSDPLPYDSGTGSSLEYDGSQYIYWIRAGGTTTFYRYDTQGSAGSRWSQRANTLATLSYGAHLVYKDGYVYTMRGNNIANNPFYRYTPGSDSWDTMSNLPIDVYNDGILVDGGDNYLYACKAENTANCYRYSISGNSWEAIANAPANIYQGGAGASNRTDHMYVIAGAGGTNTFTNGVYSYIFQTSNSSFEESGNYISPTHDMTSVYKYANISLNYTSSTNTSLSVYTRTSTDGSNWGSWAQVTEEKQTGTNYSYKVASTPYQYMQAKFEMSSSDGIYSGVINDYTIYYYQDLNVPTNPTIDPISVYSTATQAASINNNTWYNYDSPFFDWPDAEESNGAADGVGGSGVAGYYVYFGTDSNADASSSGTLTTSSNYTASNLTSGNTYYLRIQTVDDAGNFSSENWQPFIYKFDNEVPNNPTTIVVDPPGYSATNSFTFTWSGASDSASLVSQYCYKTGVSDSVDTCISEASASGALAYQTGTNNFYVRAKDTAGNYASSYANASFYYSSTAPSAPQNLRVTYPADSTSNTVNEFAFAWDPPSTYYGQQAGLRYYYSFNELPTIDTVNSIGLSVTYLSKGSCPAHKGVNTLYVITQDEAGNIDFNLYSSVNYTADTTAPGIPRNIDASDVSIKETSSWRLALSWDEPTATGSGVADYEIYRSAETDANCNTDFSAFSFIATTTQTSYVDTGLTQTRKYYCTKACDSTNECSAVSDTVNYYPDGKWRIAATLVASPSATVRTKSATVTWSTSRTSNSFVKYGKSSGSYGEEVGSSTHITSHTITLTGLDPGTTYYYKVLWTDEDGNTGQSDELSFATNPAPSVSDVKFSNVNINSAYVTFTIKNAIKATINYGKTLSYGVAETISTSTTESTHTVVLSNLIEGTAYHLSIVAEDDEENSYSSDDYTFETLPTPKILNLKIQQVVGMPTATLRLLWISNTLISSIVTYYPTANPERAADQISLALKKNHEIIMKNLLDNAEYTLIIKGKDNAGNEATAETRKVKTATDIRAPEIIDLNVESTIVGVGETAKAQIVVSWDSDEPATTQVEYAQGTGTLYGQTTQEDTSLTSNHTVTITGLKPATIYHLRAVSKDKVGNIAYSFDTVIVTPKSTKDALNLVIENLSKTFGFLKGTKIFK